MAESLREGITSLIKHNTITTEGEYSPLAGPITDDVTELLASPKELVKQILSLIIERVKGIENPYWRATEIDTDVGFRRAIQAVIKEISG